MSRRSFQPPPRSRWFNRFILGLCVITILVIGSGTLAQESTSEPVPYTSTPVAGEPTLLPTETAISTLEGETLPPAVEPTATISVEPEATEPAAGEPEATETVVSEPEATETLVSEPEETEAAEVVETPAPTEDIPAPVSTPEESLAVPLATQTYCQMNIGDANDSDPFTYTFSADSANIASFAWDFGDTGTGSGASVNHTYAAPNTYTITLTCVPTAGGSNLVLTGSIQISLPSPVAFFTINEGVLFREVVSGLDPLVLTTNNLSTPDGLTYLWGVTGPAVICDSTTLENISCSVTDYGTYTFNLAVSNASGTSNVSQQVVVLAPAPSADFTMTPSNNGAAPLTVMFAGIPDADSGPITTWAWDFNGDNIVDSNLQNPLPYTYTVSGLYNAKLTVTGPGGNMEITRGVNVFQSGNAVQAAFTMAQMGAGSVAGTVNVCFTNTSTGPITIYGWDYGDNGSVENTTSASYFCQDFPAGLLRVRLNVSSGGTGVGATSNAYRELNLVAAPVAAFTYSPTSGLTQNTQIDFNSNTSTGFITGYAWDFNGDGTTDSTDANPQDRLLAIGSNKVRLTVTGPGGSSSVEQIIEVARLELTCAINGTFNPLPGATPQTYTANIGNVAGRTVTYNWTVTGGATATGATNAASVELNLPSAGTYQLTLNASTPDGSSCSETRTITMTNPPLVCNMTLPSPAPAYPDGVSYNYTAVVTPASLAGRTIVSYAWTLNGTPQGAAGASYSYANPTSTVSGDIIRYTATASDGSTCYEETTVNTTVYPPLTCTGISGSASPIPVDGSGASQNIPYTANLTGMVGGRTAVYTWTADGASSVGSTNPTNVQWPLSYASNGTGTPSNISVSIDVTTPGVAGVTTLTCARSSNVRIENLVCNSPVGDITPVVGETNNYNYSIQNLYGRTPTINWVLSQGATQVAAGTSSPFSYQFLNPGEIYTLSYTANVSTPQADTCNASATLTVTTAVQSFTCDAFPDNGKNFSPSAAGSYDYTVDIDNGNGIPLHYDYVLVGPNSQERIIGSFESAANGLITGPSPAFTLNDLGPIGNYTLRVDVRPVDPASTAAPCSLGRALVVGGLNVNYSYVNGTGGAVNNSAVEVGTPVCFTNTSAPVPPTPSTQSSLTYTWYVDGVPQSEPFGCISFASTGNHTVELKGENDDEGDASFHREATHSVTFTAVGAQTIAISRSNEVYAPANVSFDANGSNINTYNWTFYNQASPATAIGTRTGETPSFPFTAAGTYRAVVVGTGPLGNTSAELVFTLIGTNDVLASFVPSQYAGIAPMEVCFTDTSQGQNLNYWEWDFGNGETLSYTDANIPAQICTTYPTPEQTYPVTLLVRNQSNTQATASNSVRTYSVLESSATYTITPQGGGRYCFTAEVTGGTTVTGWDFGDGTTSGPGNFVCHQFQSIGDFRVQMNVEGPGGEPGTVERTVTVTITGGTPVLTASAVCAPHRTATFTITNSGDDMSIADQVVVRNLAGDVIAVRPVLLDEGDSLVFSLSNQSGPLTLMLTDNSSVTATTTCYYPPEITVTASCEGGLPVFTVTNARPSDGPMSSPQAYQILDASSNIILTGTFQLTLGEATETITLPVGTGVEYASYSFASTGSVGIFNLPHQCAAPQVTVSASCEAGLPVFTVTNPTPSNPMAIAQAYEIRDASDSVIDSGTFQLLLNEATATITLPAGTTPYETYRFVSTGAVGTFDVPHSCAAPQVTLSATCDAGLPVFTVTNPIPGNPMVIPQAYEIRDAGGTVISSGTFQLEAGEATESISLPLGTPTYVAYTFVSAGAVGNLNLTHSCDIPQLSVSAACEGGLPAFTITNTTPSLPMYAPQDYTLENADGVVVANGQFELSAGETSERITLPSGAPLYAAYTFVSSGSVGSFSLGSRCDEPLPQVIAAVCASSDISFTVTNTSGSPINNRPYTITGSNGVVVQSTLSLAAGASETITVPASSNTGGSYSLVISGTGITVTVQTSCAEPALLISPVCSNPAAFNVTNVGSAMSAAQSYTLTSGGRDVTPQNATFLLGAGESTRITVASRTDAAAGVTFASTNGSLNATSTLRCASTAVVSGPVSTPTPTSNEFRFTGLAMVASAPVCASGCPTFQLYHTDETNDWEIFRLDSADALTRTTVRENLSLGMGEGVEDMSPSLSPDTNWVVFQSNRDGNWELYVAPTSGGDPDAVQRLTYNTIAIDGDPMWGPNNFVVFESTRNGNYDLYMIDMSTGQEYRLTDNEGDDINPYWSPDGSRVLFQSNRATDGGWQIFELNVITGALRQLSDNTAIEVDPQYSHDGSQIVFRTYANEGDSSTLAIMNADGTDRRMISDEAGDATNAAWSPSDRYIAYQSDIDGDLDVYVYDVAAGETRQLTNNAIGDYAPTWRCSDERVVFTSDISEDPNIYEADATPIDEPAILVEEAADQMTFELSNDVYPQSNPSEENASREGQTLLGAFGEQTVFLTPPSNVTPLDDSFDGLVRDDWNPINTCSAGG